MPNHTPREHDTNCYLPTPEEIVRKCAEIRAEKDELMAAGYEEHEARSIATKRWKEREGAYGGRKRR